MRAEVIAVGSEILLGDIVNTNAAWISRKLALMGIDVYHHVTVGDNPERIKQVIAQGLERSDLLVFTGGLGPTDDDLTVQTIADYFEQPLNRDIEAEEKIKKYFITRDMPMSRTNIKQADRPDDAEFIPNPVGTAPGLFWDLKPYTQKESFVACFPGVPKELFAMWDWLETKLDPYTNNEGQRQLVFKEFMHFFGIGESKLGEAITDLMTLNNPTVAPYVGQSSVRIRIATKAATGEEAAGLTAPIKAEIINRLGQYYFGEGEDARFEQAVGSLLLEKQQTVATAESCTGGLVSHRLTNVSGSSAYIAFNAVTYSNEQKTKVLGVSEDLLANHGAVSAEVAEAMATGIQRSSGSDIGIALTGIAGPDGGTPEKPVGLVYIGLKNGDKPAISKKVMVNPNYPREDIKHWFSQYALYYLRLLLLDRLEQV